MAIPSATPYNRNVGYLGVVPTMRGRGYIDEILGEITRLHAADAAELITATTDTTNTPTAAALERAGYTNTEIRLIFEAPRADGHPAGQPREGRSRPTCWHGAGEFAPLSLCSTGRSFARREAQVRARGLQGCSVGARTSGY